MNLIMISMILLTILIINKWVLMSWRISQSTKDNGMKEKSVDEENSAGKTALSTKANGPTTNQTEKEG